MGLFSFVCFSGFSYVVSLVLCVFVNFMMGVYHTSIRGLSLDQLPEFRGSMMSVFAAFASVGSFVSLSLGGFVLDWFGWVALGVFATIFCLSGFIVLNIYAIEPETS